MSHIIKLFSNESNVLLTFPIEHNSSWRKLTLKMADIYNVPYTRNTMYNTMYNLTTTTSIELLKDITPHVKRYNSFIQPTEFEFVSEFSYFEGSLDDGIYLLTLQKNMEHIFYGIWKTLDLKIYQKMNGALRFNKNA